MDYKYDVFISYSRKDYVDENQNVIPGNAITRIQETLTKAGYTYWFDKDGIESGQQFAEVIEKAISESLVFIFVSSKASNASIWTTREIFAATDNQDEKYIIPVRLDDTPYNKRFRMLLRPYDFCDFWTNPEEALKNILKSVKSCKSERAKRKAEEENIRIQLAQQKAKQQAMKELVQLAEVYQGIKSKEDVHRKKLISKMNAIDITECTCPVCQTKVSIESSYCPTCAWTMSPILGIKEAKYLLEDLKPQVKLAKSIWSKSINKENEKHIEQLQENLADKEEQIKEAQTKLADLEKQLREEKVKSINLSNANSIMHEQLEKQERRTQSEMERLKTESAEKEKTIKTLTAKLQDNDTEHSRALRRKDETIEEQKVEILSYLSRIQELEEEREAIKEKNSTKESEDKNEINSRVKVTFPTGEVIMRDESIDTLVDIIHKVGIRRAFEAQISVKDKKLIAPYFATSQISQGYIQARVGFYGILTRIDLHQQVEVLHTLSHKLRLDLTIEIVSK